MNQKEMGSFLSGRNTGLVFSPRHRLSLGDSYKNLALVAPTGSGKTTHCTYEGISEYARTVARSLMRADEVRMMQPGKGVLISGRERPALVEMPAFFDVLAWKTLAEKKPARVEYDGGLGKGVRYLPLGDESGRQKETFTFPEMSGFSVPTGIE
jgi:hypothetical protein